MTLARFRAHPRHVRVSIRRVNTARARPGWCVTVKHRHTGHQVFAIAKFPRVALRLAMDLAASCQISGVDLHMGWSHPHPWK